MAHFENCYYLGDPDNSRLYWVWDGSEEAALALEDFCRATMMSIAPDGGLYWSDLNGAYRVSLGNLVVLFRENRDVASIESWKSFNSKYSTLPRAWNPWAPMQEGCD